MLQGKVAGALVCSLIVATTAAAWSLLGHAAAPGEPLVPQTANRSAKADRLPVAGETPYTSETTGSVPTAYSLAALSTMTFEPPKASVEPNVEPRRPPAAAAPDKTKRPEPQRLLLDDNQIASLKTRLRLTRTQEELWPAVEASLREVVRHHARRTAKVRPGGVVPQLDVNSAEVQQLVAAATPLIMRLSEEQKREVRSLARIIGLETVASRI